MAHDDRSRDRFRRDRDYRGPAGRDRSPDRDLDYDRDRRRRRDSRSLERDDRRGRQFRSSVSPEDRHHDPYRDDRRRGRDGRPSLPDPNRLDYLVSFKQFAMYIRSLSDAEFPDQEMNQRYQMYREGYFNRQMNLFFDEHKGVEWFKEKYHPEHSKPLQAALVSRKREYFNQFIKDLDAGNFDSVVYDEEFMPAEGAEASANGDATAKTAASPATEASKVQHTLVIKSVPPNIPQADLLELCKTAEGFTELILSDPHPNRRFHRVAWVKFKDAPSMVEALKLFANAKIGEFHFSFISYQPEPPRRRTVPSVTSLSSRLAIDLSNAKKLAAALDKECAFDTSEGMKDIEGASGLMGVQVISNRLEKVILPSMDTTEIDAKPEPTNGDLDTNGEKATVKAEPAVDMDLDADPAKPDADPDSVAMSDDTQELGVKPAESKPAEAAGSADAADAGDSGDADVPVDAAAAADPKDSKKPAKITDHKLPLEPWQVKQLKKQLDLHIVYLREVHLHDYYGTAEALSKEDFERRGAIYYRKKLDDFAKTLEPLLHFDIPNTPLTEILSPMTVKEPPGLVKTREQRVDERWLDRLDQRLHLRFSELSSTSDEMAVAGGKNLDAEVDATAATHVTRVDEGKFRCKICQKLFKGEEFVKKHVRSKHPDELADVAQDVEYFNNFVRDPQRPAHPAPSTTPGPFVGAGPGAMGMNPMMMGMMGMNPMAMNPMLAMNPMMAMMGGGGGGGGGGGRSSSSRGSYNKGSSQNMMGGMDMSSMYMNPMMGGMMANPMMMGMGMGGAGFPPMMGMGQSGFGFGGFGGMAGDGSGRGRGGGGGGGRGAGGYSDPRGIRSYEDLDAPAQGATQISYE